MKSLASNSSISFKSPLEEIVLLLANIFISILEPFLVSLPAFLYSYKALFSVIRQLGE